MTILKSISSISLINKSSNNIINYNVTRDSLKFSENANTQVKTPWTYQKHSSNWSYID